MNHVLQIQTCPNHPTSDATSQAPKPSATSSLKCRMPGGTVCSCGGLVWCG